MIRVKTQIFLVSTTPGSLVNNNWICGGITLELLCIYDTCSKITKYLADN